MAQKGEKTKVGQDKSETVASIPLACANEQAAVEFFERQRWGDKPCCAHCQSENVYQMKSAKTGERNARYLWRCRECKKQYTVRIGTVLEDSRIPLRHWAYAFWRACTSKKGVSALEIKRHTGLSYKSALFLMHRIRFAMSPINDDGDKLTGTVEVDETYVGGKPRGRRRWIKGTTKRNKRGISSKQPVLATVARETGQVKVRVIPDVKAETLKQAVNELVDKSAHLVTDELRPYFRIGRQYASHRHVKHALGEYVRGDVTTNTIEGFFSILKRGIFGVYHNVSRKHL